MINKVARDKRSSLFLPLVLPMTKEISFITLMALLGFTEQLYHNNTQHNSIEWHYAEWHYDGWHVYSCNAECHYAEWDYHYAERQ